VSSEVTGTTGRTGSRGVPRAIRERLILDVAGQVFAQGDFHSSSMDEIASRAGVSKPMLYAYFESKEGLYAAYVERTGGDLVTRLLAAGGVDDPPAVRLRARICEFLAFVEEHRDGWTVLFRELASSRPLADQVAALRRQITDAVERMVAGSVSELHEPDREAIAHMIVGAGESLANWWLGHPEVRRESVADWYVEAVTAVVAAALRR
jgi:AcrR family transcriptional regulator